MVPGVPAFAAAAAALKRELTVPTVGQTVILTRVAQRATPMPEGEDLATLGRSGALLVLHLAAMYVDRVVAELLPHYGADCPAAVVAMASRPDELVLRGTLSDIADQVKAARRGPYGRHHGRPHAGRRAVPRQPSVLGGPGTAARALWRLTDRTTASG